MRQFAVYIMSSRSRVLYTGVTRDLERRVFEHKTKQVAGFTRRYNVTRLVHFEVTENSAAAIEREKQIKSWTRAKRLELIRETNPGWQDLAADWFDLDGRGYRDPSLAMLARDDK